MTAFNVLWAYKGFVFGSTKREFQSKYRNSLLGAGWSVINPLAMIFVYTVIFSQIMRAKLPGVDHGFAYSIYLCAGVLTWGFFAEITTRAQSVFLDNANLLKKISFPKVLLPVIVVLNAFVNFIIVFSIFLLFLLVAGFWPGGVFIAVIPLLFIQVILAIGLGITLGVLNVFFRDVGQFYSIFLQFWFWLTPVVYPVSILPESLRSLMSINPLFPLIHSYQSIFVSGLWPDWYTLIYPAALGVCLCISGFHLFRRHVGEMMDEL